MGVNVDQARGDNLPARINRLGGVSRDVGLDRCDLSPRDRHVALRVEPYGRVDDPPAFDH
jgi:hypothetical protein